MRLGAFIVLLAVLGVMDFPGPHYSHLLSNVACGTATVIWLVLAWIRFHRIWFAWLMTTLDVGLMIHFYAMLVLYGGMSADIALGIPGTLMIFLFLAHAAVRYRPELIICGTILFVVGWASIHASAEGGLQHHWPSRSETTELAFLVILGLTALALFLTASRARTVLLNVISEMRLRMNLSRFVPEALTDELALSERALLAPRSQKAAILFVDVRGFTTMAEGMAAEEVVAFLNDYRRRVTTAILEHHGTVDKFIGDGVMAVFGIPTPRFSDALEAVRGARAVLNNIELWNAERQCDGLPPISVGAGAHFGDVVVGAIGDTGRLEYTVIGDAVNVAQRLERLCAETGKALIASRDLLDAARRAGGIGKWTELPVRSIRGRIQRIRLFAPAA